MNTQIKPAPILVFTYGNPSRGDDALGPAMYDLLEKHKKETDDMGNVELLTDYQLQIEHAVDLEQRECVLFVDASVSASPPYDFQQLIAEQDESYTTHAMNPAAVLSVYQQVNKQEHPPSFMLTIRGYEFDLGEGMTEQATLNLLQRFEFVKKLLKTSIEKWHKKDIIEGISD